MEKTGTTTVQQFLTANRQALIQNNILYPITGGHQGSQYGFIFCANTKAWMSDIGRSLLIFNEEDRKQYEKKIKNDLQKEIVANSNWDTLLISSEHFHSRLTSIDEIAALRDFFSNYADDFRIVLYLRRQDRVAISHYSTKLKLGMPSPEIFPTHTPISLDYYYDYEKIYDNWEKVFGASAINIRFFDRSKYVNNDLLSDFCAACNIDLTGKIVPPNKNESVNQAGVDFLLELNRQVPRVIDQKINPLHTGIVSIVSNICRGKNQPSSRSKAYEFYSFYRSGNERLKSRIFPKQESPLFDEDFSEYPEHTECLGPRYEEAVQICVQIYKTLIERYEKK
ncbi:hypothetical protein [Nitrosomonas communis]|nr:hypothetical protein [Nitrosomonas communis]